MVFVCFFFVIFITIFIKIINIFMTEITIFIIKINLNLILQYALKCRFWRLEKGPTRPFRWGGSDLNGQCLFKMIYFLWMSSHILIKLIEKNYNILEKKRKRQNEEDTVVKSPLSGVLFSLMKSNHFPHNITVTVFSVPLDSRRG